VPRCGTLRIVKRDRVPSFQAPPAGPSTLTSSWPDPSLLTIAVSPRAKVALLLIPHPAGGKHAQTCQESPSVERAALPLDIRQCADRDRFFQRRRWRGIHQPRSSKMLGYSEEELIHLENWDRIVHSDDRVSGAKRYADLQQGKRDRDEGGATSHSPGWPGRVYECTIHFAEGRSGETTLCHISQKHLRTRCWMSCRAG
jgi:hypothetical protein